MTAGSCLRLTPKSDLHEAHTQFEIASPVSLHYGSLSLAMHMRHVLGLLRPTISNTDFYM
jgi:hypothetical protein